MMMRILITIALMTLTTFNLLSQDIRITSNNNQVQNILKNWDPIRGEWLASGLIAMADNTPAPTRTFPERLTIAQLFAFVPVEKRDSVQKLLIENDSLRQIDNMNFTTIGMDFLRMALLANRAEGILRGFTFGEPHIVDFNNEYTMQNSIGEFILVKSKTSKFEVQARFETIQGDASFTTAATMNVAGDLVSFYANEKPDNIDYTVLRVNGVATTTLNNAHYLPMGGLITYENKQYKIDWPTGESVIVELKPYRDKKFINIAIQVYTEDRSDYEGLAAGHNNSGVSEPSDFQLDDSRTLFTYSEGKRPENYFNRSQHQTFKRKLSTVEIEDSRALCENAGVGPAEMEGCIYDYAHFGIAPNPRPTFVHPTDRITLVPIDSPISSSDLLLTENEIIDEPKKRRKINLDLNDSRFRQEMSRAIFQIVVQASRNSNMGNLPIGR